MRAGATSGPAAAALVLGGSALAGAALAYGATASPGRVVGVGVAGAALLVGLGLVRGIEGALGLVLVGGLLVLDYGFANLGFRIGTIPIPLTEVILLPLAGLALSERQHRLPRRVLVPMLLLLAFVAARLAVDVGQWGLWALRDVTTVLEALACAVGYRVMRQHGVDRWRTALTSCFVLVLVYGSLYPWRDDLVSVGPLVGLQREVPLLGSMAGTGLAAAGAALFFLVLARRYTRALLFGWGLAVVAAVQARGLYLVLPLAALTLGWALRLRARTVVAAVVGVAVGLSLLSGAARLGVQGRLGELSLSFYMTHFGTLLGEAGPGAGTIVGRANWWMAAADEWQSSLASALFGVGLGPDLASGFRLAGDIFVRKPHNDYLEILARTGIVGLGLFLWLVAVLVVPLARAARRSSQLEGRFCAWVLATSVCYLGIANTQPLLAFPYGAVPLFFFLGAGLAVAEPVIADSAQAPGALPATRT